MTNSNYYLCTKILDIALSTALTDPCPEGEEIRRLFLFRTPFSI
ncbi:MAG: hypothetical protein ACC609_00660 [Methanobacterium formicicum]